MTDKKFSIREIFNGYYSIPIYQRAYAWTDNEIETLIDDIYDYYSLDNNQNYYIGSLVVHKGDHDIEHVIDGQQRLTTLSLLICYLKNESEYKDVVKELNVNLDFESRKRSTDIITYLKKNNEKGIVESSELVDGYRILKKKLKNSEKYDEKYFLYLLDHVILIKNELPKDTDLNHYFEIMNNRGEQLEKHEIVKAHLISKLADSDDMGRKIVAEVWNATQRLDKYVQIGFKPSIRSKIFGEMWDDFVPIDYSTLKKMFEEDSEHESSFLGFITIDKIIQSDLRTDEREKSQKEDDDTGRYYSIINFPNFLLHVLKLFTNNSFDRESKPDVIQLDDKKIINQFKNNIQNGKDVEDFVYFLLKTRYIFDNYVIKTDSLNDATEDGSNWSLHKPYRLPSKSGSKLSPRNTFYNDENIQETVVKIQSMFQVTEPRQIYKSFLYEILKMLNFWIDSKDDKELVTQLISFAKERYKAWAVRETVFNDGVNTPNYIFNFLDFLLWYQQKIEGKDHGVKANEFEFKYRNSVEHFYPQNPSHAENHKRLHDRPLNNFGNLCIMTRRNNSLRSNLMPLAKIEEFSSTSQSLKFEIMERITNEKGVWDETEIFKHGNEMKRLLVEFTS